LNLVVSLNALDYPCHRPLSLSPSSGQQDT
jgi:hypothetical protein